MSLSVFKIIYYVFLTFYFILSFFSLEHLWRYGKKGFGVFFIIFVYLAVTTIILFIVWQELADVDWQTPLTILQFGRPDIDF